MDGIEQHPLAAGPTDEVEGLSQAAVWGLVRVAQTEHPDRALRLVDLDDASSPAGVKGWS